MKKSIILSFMLLPFIINAQVFEIDGIQYHVYGYGDQVEISSCSSYNGDLIIPEEVSNNGITYPVTYIGSSSFRNCSGLTSVRIPSSVQGIGTSAFTYCTALKHIYFPDSPFRIGDWAFGFCSSLTEVTIPQNITNVGKEAFAACNALTSIVVEDDNPKYDSRNNCNAIIETSSNTIIAGCMNTIIPNSVTVIGWGAFYGCSGLTSISIPEGVTSISGYAFYNCINLTSMIIPDQVTDIGRWAFYNCEKITNLIIGNSVKSIDEEAFGYCRSLTTVTIPQSVTSLANYVFNVCERLTSVSICGNIENVGSRVFYISPTTLFIASEVSYIPNFGISPNRIYCFATIPPTCHDGTFTSYLGYLHVPASSLASYFAAPIWENFNSMDGDAIGPIGLNFNKTFLNLSIGEQENLIASVVPSNAYPNSIYLQSSNPSVATISNGKVTAVAVGECDIIARCFNLQAVCHVTVSNNGEIIITLDQHEAQVLPNHIITLYPSSSTDVLPQLFVTSSDQSIAFARVVDNSIRIVGIREGETIITVGSSDGSAQPDTCLVTVYTEPGDLDCDGYRNISDVTTLIDYLLSGNGSQISLKNADVDGDGKINISDVTTLIDFLLRGA